MFAPDFGQENAATSAGKLKLSTPLTELESTETARLAHMKFAPRKPDRRYFDRPGDNTQRQSLFATEAPSRFARDARG